jgi:hypothetical protein
MAITTIGVAAISPTGASRPPLRIIQIYALGNLAAVRNEETELAPQAARG